MIARRARADAVHDASLRDQCRGKAYSLRGALIVTALATALGFAVIGTQHLPLAVLLDLCRHLLRCGRR